MLGNDGILFRKQNQARPGIAFLIMLLLVLGVSPALAADAADDSISWAQMVMGLLGGLALFLSGMDQLGDGLKAAAGDSMKSILARFTTNRVSAALTGAAVTAVIQSSSITTVLVVGFVSAGIMTFTQSIGVIMGANVGTTITAQIVAFKVEELALGLVAVGFALLFLGKTDRVRQIGAIVMGLGLIFFGMSVMSEAMHPLRSYPPFMDLMRAIESPLPAVLVGAVFTALVQSSSATTGIVIVMAASGLISLETGIALALGANIGTCVTAGLAAIGKPVEAQRAAAVHVLFNLVGVVVWIFFIQELAGVSRSISPTSEGLTDLARISADAPRQIANANTIFNLLNTAVLLSLAGYIERLVVKMLPARPVEERQIIRPKFLDEELLSSPSLALQGVRFEVGILGDIVKEMLDQFRGAVTERSTEQMREVRLMDDKIDVLFASIVSYLGQVRKRQLSDVESLHLENLLRAGSNMEAIGDAVSERLTAISETWIAAHKTASEKMQGILRSLFDATSVAVESATKAIREDNQVDALAVMAAKPEFERLVDEALTHQSQRIALDEPAHLETIRLEMEVVHVLRQIFSLSRRIAETVVPAVVLSESGRP